MKNLFEELKVMLSESIPDCINREKTAFDHLTNNNTGKLILFGSGGLGRRTLSGLKKLNILPLCFCDNNQALWNKKVDDLVVLSPEDAVSRFPDAIFILCIWSDRVGHPLEVIQSQLNRYKETKLISFSFLYWKYPEVFLPYFPLDLPHKTLEQSDSVISAYSLWADQDSRNEYIAQIGWRLNSDFGILPSPVRHNAYFAENLYNINSEEIFIDCGAFDGDTLKSFLAHRNNSFCQYFAFEPDLDNYQKLQSFVADLNLSDPDKIKIKQCATGHYTGKIRFESAGTDQSVIRETGNTEVDCVALDDVLSGIVPTFIKMDVEGFEPNIITGAQKTISKYSPLLAFSIYHKFDHLWHLPLMLNAINKDYKYFLRPHCQAGWDLVCYAVPKNRICSG